MALGALALGGLSLAGGVIGGFGARREAAKQRKYMKRMLGWATQQAEEERTRFTESKGYRAAQEFYQSYLDEGPPEFLMRNYANRMRAAQAARGTAYGGAGALGESLNLALLTEQGRWQAAQQGAGLEERASAMKLNALGQFGSLAIGAMPYMQPGPDPMSIAAQGLSSGVQGFAGGMKIAKGNELNRMFMNMLGDQSNDTQRVNSRPGGSGYGYGNIGTFSF